MKRIILIMAITIGSIAIMNSQTTRFGITAGYTNANAKFERGGFGSQNEGQSGIYVGIVLDNRISDSFAIQGELEYVNVDNVNFLQLPVFAKVYFANTSFYALGGVQVTYTLEEVLSDFTKFNIAIGPGLGYDINNNFFVNARYMFQLNNYFTGPDIADITSRIDFFNIGLGYKFN